MSTRSFINHFDFIIIHFSGIIIVIYLSNNITSTNHISIIRIEPNEQKYQIQYVLEKAKQKGKHFKTFTKENNSTKVCARRIKLLLLSHTQRARMWFNRTHAVASYMCQSKFKVKRSNILLNTYFPL